MEDRKTISIDKIQPNPNQIRKYFDKEFLDTLSQSIKKFGIVVPILALKDGTIVAGEQRWRAAKKAGKKELIIGREILFLEGDLIKSSIGEKQDLDVINAIENLMRRNLDYFEEADGVLRLVKEYVGDLKTDDIINITSSILQGSVSKEQKQYASDLRRLSESMGIPITRINYLMHITRIEPKTRNYVRERSKLTDSYQFSLTKLYYLSKVPRQFQLKIAKGVVKRGFSAPSIYTVYKQWREGKRDNNFRLSIGRTDRAELDNVNAAIMRRDETVRKIQERETKEHGFSWPGFSVDVTMLLNDTERAMDSDAKDISPSLLERIEKLLGKMTELRDKLKQSQKGTET